MKRFFGLLTAMILMLTAVAPLGLAAEEDYVIENGVLLEYKGEGGDIVIPEGVTKIGKEVFQFKRVESIQFPSTLKC